MNVLRTERRYMSEAINFSVDGIACQLHGSIVNVGRGNIGAVWPRTLQSPVKLQKQPSGGTQMWEEPSAAVQRWLATAKGKQRAAEAAGADVHSSQASREEAVRPGIGTAANVVQRICADVLRQSASSTHYMRDGIPTTRLVLVGGAAMRWSRSPQRSRLSQS